MKTIANSQKIETSIYEILDDYNLKTEETVEIVDGIMAKIKEYYKTPLELVAEFHKTFQHPINNSPLNKPRRHLRMLRYMLIFEELTELVSVHNDLFEFMENVNQHLKNELSKPIRERSDEDVISETYDAFADLKYVIAGAELVFGTRMFSEDVFQEVHDSNMSKLCKTVDEVKKTLEDYSLYEKDTKVSIVYNEDGSEVIGYILKRNDGKVLKSIDYKPADIKSIVLLNYNN